MKKTYELSEYDIRTAICCWLKTQEKGVELEAATIKFGVKECGDGSLDITAAVVDLKLDPVRDVRD